jgi:hypothetical protein
LNEVHQIFAYESTTRKEDIIKGRREAEREPSDCTILISATIRTTNKADHNKGSTTAAFHENAVNNASNSDLLRHRK